MMARVMNRVAFALLLVAAMNSNLSCREEPQQDQPPVLPPVDEEYDGDPDIGDISSPEVFYDKFEGALNTSEWERMNMLWGQPANESLQHGGVIRENVSTQSGYAVLRALGDEYDGPLRGVQGHSKRLGGVLKSHKRFASGRYEVKMKVLQVADVGVVSTAWIFWYKEITRDQFPAAFDKALAHGNVARDGVIIMNHEIDIEVKGKDLANPVYTNWIGLTEPEYDSEHIIGDPLLDNQFHVYRWDWHAGGNGIMPEVKYYIDDKLIRVSSKNVPYIASYFYVGNWFAWWAGNDDGSYNNPAFDSRDMLVDWVKITPFFDPEDDWFE
jgi:hypothetical protein